MQAAAVLRANAEKARAEAEAVDARAVEAAAVKTVSQPSRRLRSRIAIRSTSRGTTAPESAGTDALAAGKAVLTKVNLNGGADQSQFVQL